MILIRRKVESSIEEGKIRVFVRESIYKSWVVYALLFIVLIGILLYDGIFSHFDKYVDGVILTFLFFYTFRTIMPLCYYLGRSEESMIDLLNRTFVRKVYLYGIRIKKIKEKWNVPFEISYKIEKKYNYFWLTIISQEEKDVKKIIRFFDEKAFLDFYKFLNENFPDQKIADWIEK